MGNLSIQNGSRVNTTSSPVVYDAGESLKRALQSVITNGTNGNIDSMKSQLEATLQQHGIKNTRFVGQLLYHFRGVQQGVPGDLQKFKQAVQTARSAGALGPRGAASLLGMVGEAAQKQASGASVENSMLNVKNQRAPQPNRFESGFDLGMLKPVDLVGGDILRKAQRKPAAQAPVQAQQAQQPRPAKKADDVPPALERAITGIDIAAKSMPEGTLKSSLETVHSALELVKDTKELGDKEKHLRAVADLTGKTFALMRQVVKTYGENPALARLAGMQLGKIASVLGDKIAGPLKVLDNLSRVVNGETLDGSPVDKNKQADAAYDLLSSPMPAPIQAAMAIAKVEIEALYNHIGVPTQRALEKGGLNGLFAGKTPEQMKAVIQGLPTDAANANATVRKLLDIFPESRAFNGSNPDANARKLWRIHMSEVMKPDSEPLRAMINQNPKKPNTVPDLLRETVAERMKAAALDFVDQEVRKARGNW